MKKLKTYKLFLESNSEHFDEVIGVLNDMCLMDLYSQLDPDDDDYTKSSLESWCEDEVILIKANMLEEILNGL